MSEDWKAAFPRGCRVELDIKAWEDRLGRKPRVRPPYTGTVVSHSGVYAETLLIRLDGRKNPAGREYLVACVRRLPEDAGGPAP
jgi:hypothetical protein